MAVILLIDDDDQYRATVKELLEFEGYRVLDAQDGRTGIRLYRENKVDLVITDIIMPGQEGIETIQALKMLSPEVKVIAISGGGQIDPDIYLKLAKGTGAVRTFSKPFQREKLLEVIHELLSDQ